MPDPTAAPVPLVILTGFLGAGKTTTLNRVLAAQHHRRLAVLVNELGRVDIDAGLIRQRAGDVLELSGGCVCHQIGVQRELWSALRDVVDRSRPDVVLLETTGVAEPDAILEGLANLARRSARGARRGSAEGRRHDADEDEEQDGGEPGDEPGVDEAPPPVRASAIVTVVDAAAGMQQLERHDEARAQVRAADRILLTKMDLMASGPSGPSDLAALHQRLHELNPGAERAAFPDGPTGTASLIGWLLAPGAPRTSIASSVASTAAPHGLAAARPAPPGRHGPASAHHHTHQLTAASYVDDAPLVAESLLLVCAALGDRLVRAKGHIHLAGEARRAFLDRSGGRTRLDLGEPWGDERPGNRLVMIGENLDEAALHRQLWACRALR